MQMNADLIASQFFLTDKTDSTDSTDSTDNIDNFSFVSQSLCGKINFHADDADNADEYGFNCFAIFSHR